MALSKVRLALIGAGILVPVSALVLAQEDNKAEAGAAGDNSALVSTALLQQGPIGTTVSGYGTVVAAPGKARNLTFPQAGLVAEVRVTAGEMVTRGTTLLAVVTDPASRLAYEQAQTGLEFARAELERTRQLRAQNLASASQLGAAEKGLRDAEATLAAQQQLGTASERSELKAPFDGVVLDIPAALGDRTAAGAVLARMVPSDAVQVLVGLAPDDARRVKVGMPATLRPAASADLTFEGRVSHVQAMVNAQSHLVDVAVQPSPHSGGGLLPAEMTQALITLQTSTAWLAPRAAVLHDDEGAYLFQVADGHARRIRVTTGAENEQQVAVEGPFDPARKLVVLGVYELEDGMGVREAAPADTEAGGKASDKASDGRTDDNKADAPAKSAPVSKDEGKP
ncbi:MAG: efflux RND transporter periplasmic adaptor subunit [Nevskia sp.]|nr:efflux RND transporter periplasmic adaptor subunit [Nevskia sp.]